jgi:hypothetical protein
VTQDQTWDVLALAKREEAAERTDSVEADPLGFRWNVPFAVSKN